MNFYYVISEIGDHLKSYLILHGHLHRRIMDRYQNCVTIGAGSFGVNDKYKDTKNQLNLIKINKYNAISLIIFIIISFLMRFFLLSFLTMN